MIRRTQFFVKLAVLCSLVLAACPRHLYGAPLAQTSAQSPAAAGRRIGTITELTGNGFSLTSDDGQKVVVAIQDGARLLQLPPGSKDLKSAQPIALKDIAAGDRVLVSGRAGDDTRTFGATLIVLMKATEIVQQHAAEQADWQKRGMGGIVSSTDPATGTIVVTSGAKKITIATSGNTKFRRYGGDSVKFEDAKPGTLAQIQPGDQLRARGLKSADALSIQAEEIVTGSFRNVAGVILSLDASSGKVSVKDLGTKKTVTVNVTSNTSIRSLPPQVAARFAARAKGAPSSAGASRTENQAAPEAAVRRSAGMELSELMNTLPNQAIGDLKVGEAVMIVASQPDPSANQLTAITVLSGVEPILAATSDGPSMVLSPWSVGDAGSASQ